MNKPFKNTLPIISLVTICCIAMAVVETIIEPEYFIKSLVKIVLFLFVPFVYLKLKNEKVFNNSFVLSKKDVLKLFFLGLIIYFIIMAAYFLTKGVFNYKDLVDSLSSDQNVSHTSFIWVALYISFCNSLLEEFLFRFIAFIKLSEYTTKKTAYIFSSFVFALYHVAMIGSSFPPFLLVLALLGLATGGFIFNYVDDKGGNIYNSWIIHMFADFAIMTIWYIHI